MDPADIASAGMGQDDADSVMIPEGYTLFIYPFEGLQGTPEIINGLPLTPDGVM